MKFRKISTYFGWHASSQVLSSVSSYLVSTIITLLFLLAHTNVSYAQESYTLDAGRIIYVDQNVNQKRVGYNGSGSSWEQAAPDLAPVLRWADQNKARWQSNPISIYVAVGTYTPKYRPDTQVEEISKFASFLLVDNVSLYGGFDPQNGITNLSHSRILGVDGKEFGTILNGNLGNSAIAFHVVVAAGANSTALMDGFNLEGGDAFEYTGSGTTHAPKYSYKVNQRDVNSQTGGGIFNTHSSATYRNLLVQNNRAFGGGGINNDNSSSTFTNVVIRENRGVYGAGLRNESSPIRIENSQILGNYAYLDAFNVAHGGGIANYLSDLTLINSVISGNYANTGGGGIFNNNASNPTLVNSTIAGNFAGNRGSGILNELKSSPTLYNTIVWGNNQRVSIYGETINTQSSHNLIEGYSIGNIANIPSNLNVNDIFLNPHLATSGARIDGDFRLKGHPITLDQGSNSKYVAFGGNLSQDLDAFVNKRLENGTIDIGASEYFGPIGIPNPSSENIIYVRQGYNKGRTDGSSWASALNNLADALKWADENKNRYTSTNPLQIWVKEGTYYPKYMVTNMLPGTGNDTRRRGFKLVPNTQLFGGFKGYESNPSQRPNQSTSTLSGDLLQNDLFRYPLVSDIFEMSNLNENSLHVVVGAGDLGHAILDGFSITSGNANGSQNISVNSVSIPSENGGGLILIETNPEAKFSNLRIFRNAASNRGAGVFVRDINNILYNVKIQENMGAYGGGLFALHSDIRLLNGLFSNNVGLSEGAALYNSGSKTDLINGSILGNRLGSPSVSTIFNRNDNGPGRLKIANSIVGNFGGKRPLNLIRSASGSNTTVVYSLIQGGHEGTGNISDPPRLEGHKLSMYSPAVNVASISEYPDIQVYNKDIDGNDRIYLAESGGKLDMGASESSQRFHLEVPENGILYVDANVDQNSTLYNQSNYGHSWESAIPSLDEALRLISGMPSRWTAEKPLNVFVAKGIYKPESPHHGSNQTEQVFNTFQLTSNVHLYGGFDPKQGIRSLNEVRKFQGEGASVISGDFDNDGALSNSDARRLFTALNAHNIRIDGFEISHAFATNNMRDNIIQGTTFVSAEGTAISFINSSGVIENVRIHKNSTARGVIFVRGSTTNVRIVNTLVENNNVLRTVLFARDSATLNITNSTFAKNYANLDNQTAVLWVAAYAQLKIHNTIIWDNTNTNPAGSLRAIEIGELSIGKVSSFHSILQNSYDENNIWILDSVTDEGGNSNANPEFNNADAQDFRLRKTSPAKDAGLSSYFAAASNYSYDLAGTNRIIGTNIDIGAFELDPLAPPLGGQNIWYVRKGQTQNEQTGESWENAFSELALALKAAEERALSPFWNAENPLKIFVAKGEYAPMFDPSTNAVPAAGRERYASFNLPTNVHIYGGFDPDQGIEDLVHQRILPGSNQTGTTLTGKLSSNLSSYHVLIAAGDRGNAVIDGVVITGGDANQSAGPYPEVNGLSIQSNWGGGMYINQSSPKIRHVHLRGNYANGRGGAVYINDSSPQFLNVAITGNVVRNNEGAAIFNADASPIMSNVTISGNHSPNGGAINNFGQSAPTLINSVIWGNSSPVPIAGNALSTSSANNIISVSNSTNIGGIDLDWSVDDLFIEPARATNTTATTGGNFKPKAGSPLVNIGDNAQLWNTLHTAAPLTNPNPVPGWSDNSWGVDLSGVTRIQGEFLDIGAYESTYLNISTIEPDTLRVAFKTALEDIDLSSIPAATITLSNFQIFEEDFERDVNTWRLAEPQNQEYKPNVAGKYLFIVPLRTRSISDPNWYTNYLDLNFPLLIEVDKGTAIWSAEIGGQTINEGDHVEVQYGDQLEIKIQTTEWDGDPEYIAVDLNAANGLVQSGTSNRKYSIVDVGTGSMSVILHETSNYKADTLTFTIEAKPKPLTIAFHPDSIFSKTYDGTNQLPVRATHFQVDATQLVDGDDVNVELSGNFAYFADANAGTNKELSKSADEFKLIGVDAHLYAIVNSGSIQYDQGSIVKKALTITANNHLIVYDGKVYSGGNGVTYSGFVAGENENDLSGLLVYNGSSQTAIDAGLYEIMPDGLSSINYEITYLPGVLTISGGAENTLSFNIFNDGQLVQHTYGGNDLDASAVASSGLPVTYNSSDENVAQIDANGQVRIIGVGTTTITITQAGNINYETADPISVKVEVSPKTLIVTAKSITKIFDGNPFGGGNGVDYVGFVNGDSPLSLTGSLSYTGTAQGATTVGEYEILPTGLTAANYSIQFVPGKLEILQSGANILSFENFTSNAVLHLKYGAESLDATAKATSGLTPTYTSSDPAVASVDVNGKVTILKAGSATIIASQTGDGNVAPATPIQIQLQIAKQDLTVVANNFSKPYDGIPFTGGNGVYITGFVNGENESVLGGSLNFRGSSQQATKVGAYQLIAEGLASDNYNFIYEAGSLIITKRPLNISFHTDSIIEKTYDATATARIRASQLTFGANEKLADDDVYVMLKTGIGEYENERAGSNKTVTLLVTELLLGGQDWDQYAIGNVNNLTTTGRIAKKTLTITANNDIIIYSGIPYSGGKGVTYSGFVGNESENTLNGSVVYSGDAQGATELGTYSIIPSGLTSSNYDLQFLPGTLTISGGAENTLSFNVQTQGATISRTYGSGDIDGSATASSGLAVEYESSAENVAVIQPNGQITITGVGITVITASQQGNANYKTASPISFTVQVTPAQLTVKAKDVTKVYDSQAYFGGNDVEIEGFVNGETIDDLLGLVEFSGNSQGAINVGNYDLIPTGLQSPNYEITYVKGALEIVQQGSNVLSFKNYTSGTTHTMTYGVQGISVEAASTAGLPVLYQSSNSSVATVDTDGKVTITGTGLTTLTASQPGDQNVAAATPISLSMMVQKKSLEITANNQTLPYSGATYNGGNGVVFSGFVYDETINDLQGTLVYLGSAQGARRVGSYQIVPSGLSSSNYEITYITGSLNITKKPISIAFNPNTMVEKIYDGTSDAYIKASNLSIDVGGVIAGDDVEIAVGDGLGTYSQSSPGTAIRTVLPINKVTLIGADSDLYAISNNANLEGNVGIIHKKDLRIIAGDVEKTYDGTAFEGGSDLTYVGFVAHEDQRVLSGTLSFGGNAQGAINAGTYEIWVDGLHSDNYNISYEPGMLKITQNPANTLSFSDSTLTDSLKITYGDEPRSVEAIASSGLTVSYVSSNSEIVTISNRGELTIRGAGEARIAVTQAGDSNYGPADSLYLHVRVAPAQLVVTALSDTLVYSGSAYTGRLGVKYTGFVYNEDEGALSGNLNLSGDAIGAMDAGSYLIVPEGLRSSNYNLEYVPGTLAILKAQPTINTQRVQQHRYDGSRKSVQADISPDILSAQLSYSPTNSFMNAGTYTVQLQLPETKNYLGAEAQVTLIIEPATRSIEFPTLPVKVFGDASFNVSAQANTNETLQYSSSNPAVAEISSEGVITIKGAGESIITVTVNENPNYVNKPSIQHVLTVEKAQQNIGLNLPLTIEKSSNQLVLPDKSDKGLPLTYGVSDPLIASLDGNQLILHRLGTISIRATQQGDANYLAADPVTVTLQIVDSSLEVPIRVRQAVSPNGDGVNDYLYIEGIKDFPRNKMIIFNPNGMVIWEMENYDNDRIRFEGKNKQNQQLPSGTYYYIAEIWLNGNWVSTKGFFVLQR